MIGLRLYRSLPQKNGFAALFVPVGTIALCALFLRSGLLAVCRGGILWRGMRFRFP